MTTIVLDTNEPVEFHEEDGGMALVADASDDSDCGLFVRLVSWDPNDKTHREAKLLDGKLLRVTIEVL